MRKLKFLSFVFMLAAACSCAGHISDSSNSTQTYHFSDSCRHLSMNFMLEIPVGNDSVTQKIREALIADFVMNSQRPAINDGLGQTIEPAAGAGYDIQALVDSCGKASYRYLLEQAMDDCNARREFIEKEPTLSPEEKERILSEVPQWEFNLEVSRQKDAPKFVVYGSSAYVYYGGAHGGVTGSGTLTFDKATGRKIGRFIRSDASGALQGLLREGLRRYFGECGEDLSDSELLERLFIEDGTIPLPEDAACPNAAGDSLIFTYRQYEIASYADGMPSFSLSVKDLAPFLTPEGSKLLDME